MFSLLLLMIAYHAGLRLGEVYGLTWEDIDFENKLLSVNRQIQWFQDKTRTEEDKREINRRNKKGAGFWYFSSPKFDSYRTIEIGNTLYDLLLREKKKQEKAKGYNDNHYCHYYAEYPLDSSKNDKIEGVLKNPIGTSPTANEVDFVMRRESGDYITLRTMLHASFSIHTDLDFPEFDFHSLRHTHATKLLENGAPMVYIQKRLGHAKIEVTERIYTNHLTSKIQEDGNIVLNKCF